MKPIDKLYCTKCGKQIEGDSLFCSFCGQKVEEGIGTSRKNRKYIVYLVIIIVILVTTTLIYFTSANKTQTNDINVAATCSECDGDGVNLFINMEMMLIIIGRHNLEKKHTPNYILYGKKNIVNTEKYLKKKVMSVGKPT